MDRGEVLEFEKEEVELGEELGGGVVRSDQSMSRDIPIYSTIKSIRWPQEGRQKSQYDNFRRKRKRGNLSFPKPIFDQLGHQCPFVLLAMLLHTALPWRVSPILLTRRPFSATSSSTSIPVIRSLGQLRRWRQAAREKKLEVGVVPTVGLSLVARDQADYLITTRWVHYMRVI